MTHNDISTYASMTAHLEIYSGSTAIRETNQTRRANSPDSRENTALEALISRTNFQHDF